MFGWFHGLRSFRDKISWLVTLTSAVAILGVTVALAAVNHANLKHATFAALQAQTDIAALNSGAPLVFGDRNTATEVLQAFRAMRNVTSATLYTVDGAEFAHYRRDAEVNDQPGLLSPGLRPMGARMVSVTPVQEKGQALGRLQVVYDLSELNRQLWFSLLIAGLVSALAMGLAFIASRHLAAVVTRPIAVLSRTAHRVADSRDYSLRAPNPEGDDEVGSFTTAFNDMLSQVEEQDRAIKASRAQAETASRLKDEFLATVSHELRTPMTPILGWAQILRRLGQAQPQVLQAAEVIERNALAQTRIVDDLLDMSRIITGKIRLDLQSMRIDDALNAALDAVRVAADARSIQLHTDVIAGLPEFLGDPHRLQQVLWNLLSNAIKFTEPGGDVRVTVRRDLNGALQVVVSDSGQGIEAEFLPYVFERFRQADASVTRTHGGLGLGLAIVKQIVELHGGSVAVASTGIGQGTDFTVRLPMRAPDSALAKPGMAAVDAAAERHPEPLRDLRLLVVDNEPDARDWLQHVLVGQGAQVSTAASAEQALAALQVSPPDVLISDIGMPGTDGYALMRHVRELPPAEGGAVPAIALTAFARPEDRARALAAGYQLHLGKPLDQGPLVAAILSLAGSTNRPPGAAPPASKDNASPD